MRWIIAKTMACAITAACIGCTAPMPAVRVSSDHTRFVLDDSNETFFAWGHNYGHGGQLLCDFWIGHFDQVEREFRYMKHDLHANLARVHLNLPKFLDSPKKI